MMIKAILPDRTLGISFSHPEVEISVLDLEIKHGRNPAYMARLNKLWNVGEENILVRVTECSIFDLSGELIKPLWTVRVTCSILDNFNKSVGRKKSLDKAIRLLDLGKAERRIVWQSYLDRDVDPLVNQLEKQLRANLEVHAEGGGH